jgi:sugar O-acyltransferase (sialic acid O-acetyltransferase NeuD family)
MEKLIIFGAGDIAQLAHYYFLQEQRFEIVAFTVDEQYITTDTFMDLPVVAFETIAQECHPQEYRMFIAISYSEANHVRATKYTQAKEKGFELVSYVSPYATIYDNVTIGENCFIFEDNTVQPFVSIGNNVTLWSGNHIGHHSVIEDHCFITSHVVISGGVTVEPYCFIGVNATIRDHITIKRKCIIGAGSIIMRSTKEGQVYIPERTKPAKVTSDAVRI